MYIQSSQKIKVFIDYTFSQHKSIKQIYEMGSWFNGSKQAVMRLGAQKMNQYTLYLNRTKSIIPQKLTEAQNLYKIASKLAEDNLIKSKEVVVNPENQQQTHYENDKDSNGYQKYIIKIPGEYNIIILGPRNAGKRRLISYCVNQNQRNVCQQQLEQPIMYYRKNNIILWYCQLPQDYEDYPPQSINFFKNADCICILYPSSLKLISNTVKLAAEALPKRLVFIRTKCDQFQNKPIKLSKTCDQEISIDKKYIQTLGINHYNRIYAFSAHQKLDYRDNSKVKDIILGKLIEK